MKRISCIVATAAWLLFGSLTQAGSTTPSSYAPHGPEPHSSLKGKHHSKKSSHIEQGTARKGERGAQQKKAHPPLVK
jgi:hypothetical protein